MYTSIRGQRKADWGEQERYTESFAGEKLSFTVLYSSSSLDVVCGTESNQKISAKNKEEKTKHVGEEQPKSKQRIW